MHPYNDWGCGFLPWRAKNSHPWAARLMGKLPIRQLDYNNRCVMAFSTACVRSRQSSFTSTAEM